MRALCGRGARLHRRGGAGQTVPPSSPPDEWTYTVRPGDNLWTISRDYLRSDRTGRGLQSRNRVADPYRLQPGTYLRIPFAG